MVKIGNFVSIWKKSLAIEACKALCFNGFQRDRSLQ